MPNQVRPLSSVPHFVPLLLAVGLSAQLGWHFSYRTSQPSAENLPPPPSLHALQLTSLGEPIGLSKLLALYLQTFDDQPGVNKPFRSLNYDRMQAWLDLTLQLDPLAEYPLFLAGRVYGAVDDQAKQRLMFDFVYRHFFADPNRRWPSLAFVALITRHHLKNLPLAHQYAQAIKDYATGKDVPNWAKQMDIFMLEGMEEYASAHLQLDALVRSGQITDPHELRFLQERMDMIEEKVRTTKPNTP